MASAFLGQRNIIFLNRVHVLFELYPGKRETFGRASGELFLLHRLQILDHLLQPRIRLAKPGSLQCLEIETRSVSLKALRKRGCFVSYLEKMLDVQDLGIHVIDDLDSLVEIEEDVQIL